MVSPPENRDGLVHFGTTLTDSLSFEEIVLCGVDLYDRRYFFLSNEETCNGFRKRRDEDSKIVRVVSNYFDKSLISVFEKKELIFLYITLSLFCQKYYQSSIRTITKLISILM